MDLVDQARANKDNFDFKTAVVDAFSQVEEFVKTLKVSRNKPLGWVSGSTCTFVYRPLRASPTLYCAHIGDSKMIMGYKPKAGDDLVKARTITPEHRPDAPDEKKRIEAAGGMVWLE